MQATEALRQKLPEAAKDIRTNLQSVLGGSSLTPSQTWGVALACAISARNAQLTEAVLADATALAGPAVADDARAAAAIMGMNNVYYRFRHMIGKPGYSQRPPRLRMSRISQPATSRTDFELFCLAVSALAGCEVCLKAHEQAVLEGGLNEDQVHDAVRLAATINAAAIALEMGEPPAATEA